MPPTTPLRRPAAYFEQTSQSRVSGTLVFVAHLIVDLAAVFSIVWLLFRQIDNPPAGLQSELFSQLVGLAVFGAIVYAIAWLLVSALMHVLSGGSGTDGTFWDAMDVAGWAYAPEIVTAPLLLALAWNSIRGLTLDGSDPQRLVAQLETLESAAHHPVSLLVVAIVVAWSVYILAKGTAATHDVSTDKTLPPAIIVGIGAFLFALV
ncbi:Yip1 family protein [Natronosalvus vescus]|uniref:Yip1 family protein n=1 Tax=Natronosalvus vescus TaxID=2953881 RepID=UPI00209040D2|nr:Yip1 family protein [Natronosalvus vescus]